MRQIPIWQSWSSGSYSKWNKTQPPCSSDQNPSVQLVVRNKSKKSNPTAHLTTTTRTAIKAETVGNEVKRWFEVRFFDALQTIAEHMCRTLLSKRLSLGVYLHRYSAQYTPITLPEKQQRLERGSSVLQRSDKIRKHSWAFHIQIWRWRCWVGVR